MLTLLLPSVKYTLMQKIVHKILRSLPKRFHAKVTSIEDSKDLGNMKLESSSGPWQLTKWSSSQGLRTKEWLWKQKLKAKLTWQKKTCLTRHWPWSMRTSNSSWKKISSKMEDKDESRIASIERIKIPKASLTAQKTTPTRKEREFNEMSAKGLVK